MNARPAAGSPAAPRGSAAARRSGGDSIIISP